MKQSDDVVLVHLDDEAPALGSGRRYVRVLSLGYKWVRVTNPHDTSNAVRLTRRTYKRILVPQEET